MRVTREQAMAYAEWTQPLNTLTCRNLATSYLAALDVVEALVERSEARAARSLHRITTYSNPEYQVATARCFQADAALDAALEKWREGA